MQIQTSELTLDLSTVEKIFSSYIPYIKNGALFVETQHAYQLGEAVNFSLKLMDEEHIHYVKGNVVWITPPAAQNGLPTGIGIQFDPGVEQENLKKKIEEILRQEYHNDEK